MVYDPGKRRLKYRTTRKQSVGRTNCTARHHRQNLADRSLRGRERIEDELQVLIDERSNPWGVTVQSVEMRDDHPAALQDAMS